MRLTELLRSIAEDVEDAGGRVEVHSLGAKLGPVSSFARVEREVPPGEGEDGVRSSYEDHALAAFARLD